MARMDTRHVSEILTQYTVHVDADFNKVKTVEMCDWGVCEQGAQFAVQFGFPAHKDMPEMPVEEGRKHPRCTAHALAEMECMGAANSPKGRQLLVTRIV